MDQSKKRERDEAQPKQRKRKSRFGEAPAGAVDQAAAAAQAAQAAAAALAQQRALQAAQMQAQIQAQIASVKSMLDEKGIKSLSAQSGAPVPLVLDERGRQVDKFGRVVKTVGPERTFKINAKTATTAKPKVNPYLAHKTGGGLGIDTSGGRDAKPAVAVKRSRANKALQFIEPGKYIKQAENMRDKEMKKLLLDDFRNGTGEGPAKEDEEKIVLTRPRIPPTALIDVPEMEWWDEALLPATIRKARKTILEGAARPAADHAHIAATNVKTHTLVHHPVSVRPTSDKAEPTAIPLMLTKKERKRIRRQKRAELEREKRENVMLGLAPPPEPKVKISNLMLVLGKEAVADPSAVEKKVRKEMEKRQKNHDMRNLARKLTPQERKDKMKRKLTEDKALGASVAVFRVTDLSSGLNRRKIDLNATENYLSGCVLHCKRPRLALVVVEGGQRAIQRFRRLMTRRIDWRVKPLKKAFTPAAAGDDASEAGDANNQAAVEEDSDDDDEVDGRGDVSMCNLVWEGTVPQRCFANFRVDECRTPERARRWMEAKGLAHYWDLVLQDYMKYVAPPTLVDVDGETLLESSKPATASGSGAHNGKSATRWEVSAGDHTMEAAREEEVDIDKLFGDDSADEAGGDTVMAD